MTISQLPTTPSRSQSRAELVANTDAFLGALPVFRSEANALAATMSGIAAGTAFAIPYTFSTTTTDSDPGTGFIRLDNATQNASTAIRLDLIGADAVTYTELIDTFDDSSSAVKGQIILQKLGDATKWLAFNLTALASPSGYKNLTVVNVASSSASPFTNNDQVVLKFTRTGDVGIAGTVTKRVTSIVSSATPTPNATTDDMYVITALATAPTFGAPTGSPSDGQPLMIRVKDNGTARALAFNTIYRASTDLALPSSTAANKTLYMGFIYNSADIKWDLVAVLSNFS